LKLKLNKVDFAINHFKIIIDFHLKLSQRIPGLQQTLI